MSLNPSSESKNNKNGFLYHFGKVHPQEYIADPNATFGPHMTFQGAMKYTILIGQLFGLNPVLGIFGKSASKLRFSIYSGRCIYTILSIIGQTILVITCFYKLLRHNDTTISSTGNAFLVFYFANSLITISFFRMAMRWPQLSKQIEKIEIVDPNIDRKLAIKINITCISTILLSTVEHVLSDLSEASLARVCQPEKRPFDAYLYSKFHWIWKFMPYSTSLGLFCKFINIQCNMNWSFTDAFIMCMCWYLVARLKQVNDRINAVRGKRLRLITAYFYTRMFYYHAGLLTNAPISFWRTMREDYTKATNLVRLVDDTINGVIFISFASNLFTYCFLLLHLLEKGLEPSYSCNTPTADPLTYESYEHATYFIFALVFFIIRFLAVSLLAAQVNSASCEPAYALYDVPSASYCVEVQRFLEQVHGDSVVLTGLQFFSVKRGMVLTIAATIVTYELVLIQLSSVSK